MNELTWKDAPTEPGLWLVCDMLSAELCNVKAVECDANYWPPLLGFYGPIQPRPEK